MCSEDLFGFEQGKQSRVCSITSVSVWSQDLEHNSRVISGSGSAVNKNLLMKVCSTCDHTRVILCSVFPLMSVDSRRLCTFLFCLCDVTWIRTVSGTVSSCPHESHLLLKLFQNLISNLFHSKGNKWFIIQSKRFKILKNSRQLNRLLGIVDLRLIG